MLLNCVESVSKDLISELGMRPVYLQTDKRTESRLFICECPEKSDPPRNEKLARLFYRMKLIKAYGHGISKIISCYKGLSVQPKFENVEGALRIILPNTHAQSLSVEEEKYLPVLRLCEKQEEISRSDVEKTLGVGTTHAVNMLKEMLSKGLIKKGDSGRLIRHVMKQS